MVRGWWSASNIILLWSRVGGQVCYRSLEGPFRNAFGKKKNVCGCVGSISRWGKQAMQQLVLLLPCLMDASLRVFFLISRTLLFHCLLFARVLQPWLCVRVESLKQANFAEDITNQALSWSGSVVARFASGSPLKLLKKLLTPVALTIPTASSVISKGKGKATTIASAYRASEHLIVVNAARCFQLAASLLHLVWTQKLDA